MAKIIIFKRSTGFRKDEFYEEEVEFEDDVTEAEITAAYVDWKIERGVLLPEPEWLDEKIRLQYQTLSKRHNAFWTSAEDALLQSLLKTNMTYKQIGERMGRTDKAIERRVGILAARAMGREAK